MNCVISSIASILKCPRSEVYIGIGHGEPIHVSEVVAYVLTRGFGMTPSSTDSLSYDCLIEGHQSDGTPHMIARINYKYFDVNPKPGFVPEIYWFLIPTIVNPEYIKQYNKMRDEWLKIKSPEGWRT